MKVLVVGAKGFVGKNLCECLKCIRDGKDCREDLAQLLPLEIYEADKNTSAEELSRYCAEADFVFNLAGVNRPSNADDFMRGNADFAATLLDMLSENGNTCPVMLASSVQASLEGRYKDSEYGRSKLEGERIFFEYGEENGADVLVYRFPNLYGKWCRPNYNSAVATFCNNIARGLPIVVNDPDVELELLYIDDLVEEMLKALLGHPARSGRYCVARPTDKVTLGKIVSLLHEFKSANACLGIPDVSPDSFSKKLYSTFQSYLPVESMAYPLESHIDERGSFTELIHTPERGQLSVNVSNPGVTKGQHWHNTKWEKFCVVSGRGLIRQRLIGEDECGNPHPVIEFEVSGDRPEVVEMLPGYTHDITNMSDTEKLITVMWCNEVFDPSRPDTFFLEV